MHARWAMLGVAGSLAVEILGLGNWLDAPLMALNGGVSTYMGKEVSYSPKNLRMAGPRAATATWVQNKFGKSSAISNMPLISAPLRGAFAVDPLQIPLDLQTLAILEVALMGFAELKRGGAC